MFIRDLIIGTTSIIQKFYVSVSKVISISKLAWSSSIFTFILDGRYYFHSRYCYMIPESVENFFFDSVPKNRGWFKNTKTIRIEIYLKKDL
ncbi:unnamed protein product [Rhizophagus irregularis]|nr:unnamed protein product [Rhizophagus irregularis]